MRGARTRSIGSIATARLGLLGIALAASLWPQTITSLNSSRIGGSPSVPAVAGITTGPQLAGSGGFILYINGTFLIGIPPIVTWTAPGQQPVTLQNQQVSVSQISVLVPEALYSTAVPAVQTATIRVQQNTGSDSAGFTLNPPMSLPQPLLPIASRNKPYSTPLVLGGTGPFSVTPGSSSVPGLTTGTGAQNDLLSGTPTQAGFFTIQPSFTDKWGITLTQTDTVYVVPPAQIDSPASINSFTGVPLIGVSLIGSGFVDQVVNQSVTIPGSVAQWRFGSQVVPLTTNFVSPSRLDTVVPFTLLFSPVAATISVLQPDGTVSNAVTVTVAAPVLQRISPASGPAGVGFRLTAFGQGFGFNAFIPDTSTIRFGSTFLTTTLNDDNSVSATVPANLVTAAASPIPVVVFNPGGTATNSLSFIVTVPQTLALGFNSLGQGTAGALYSFRVTAVGGVPPYTFTVTGLPPGVSFNAQTGDISGIPIIGGTYPVTIGARDQQNNTVQGVFNLVIALPPPQITTPSALPNGTVGVAYTATIDANGPNAFTFSISSGSLPDGLSLLGNGLIFGRPEKPGTFNFSIQGTDASGTNVGKGFTITILPAPLLIPGASAFTGTVGKALSIDLTPTGGVTPYRYSLNCALPGGLAFSNGVISGTPTTAGAAACRVVVTDSAGVSASKDITITIAPPTLSLAGGTLPGGQVGVSYSAQVAATGGVAPYTYSGSGGPAGLSVSGSGAISGTPTTFGSFSFSITATDSTGAKATGTFTIGILPPKLVITTASLPDGTVGVAYSASLAASGGSGQFGWTVTGLPDGLSASAAGAISGTPRTAGKFTVAATVRDSLENSATASFTVTIALPPLGITTASLPGGTVGATYSATFTATGGNQQLTWSATNLPPGLRISTAGVLSGTPTLPGTSNVTIGVADSTGAAVTKVFPIEIVLPAVPPIAFGGVGDTSTPLQQPRLSVSFGSIYPVDVVVTLTITFAPDSGADDPTIQFATGGRTARILVPAGATVGATDIGIQTGSVAGVITVAAQLQAAGTDATPSPAPRRTIRVAPAAPVITALTATRNATGFTVTITGFVTTREATQANFTFVPATGQTLGTTSLTVTVDTLFSGYFGSAAAAPFGGQFTFTQAFTVNGSSQFVASVTVTLANRVGTSAASTATVN